MRAKRGEGATQHPEAQPGRDAHDTKQMDSEPGIEAGPICFTNLGDFVAEDGP